MQALLPGSLSSQRGCAHWSSQRPPLLSGRQLHQRQAPEQQPCSSQHRQHTRSSHCLATVSAAASPAGPQPHQSPEQQAFRQAVHKVVGAVSCAAHWLSSLAKSSEYRLARRNLKILMMAAPLVRSQSNTLLLLTKAMAKFVDWYVLLLFLRVLLSWFPTFKWEGQPWLAVRQLTDPYLNIFRNIIPPLMGVMDFTPLLGFVILQNLQGWLQKVSKAPGEFDW